MIKVKINPEILNEEVQPYDVPILVYNPNYAIIVLASTDCGDYFKGTIISSTNPEHPIGEYYQHWEKSDFYIINDEIILKNEQKKI